VVGLLDKMPSIIARIPQQIVLAPETGKPSGWIFYTPFVARDGGCKRGALHRVARGILLEIRIFLRLTPPMARAADAKFGARWKGRNKVRLISMTRNQLGPRVCGVQIGVDVTDAVAERVALVHYVVRVAFKARGGPWLEHYPRGIVQTDDVHVPFMVYRCLLLSSVQVSKKIKAKILSKVRATFFFLTWNGVKKKISRTLLRVAPPLFPGQPGHRPTPTSFADAFENLLQFLLGKPILFYRRHFWHLQAMARRCEYVAATKLVDVGFSIFSHIVGPFLERSRHSPLALLFYFTDRPKKLTDAPPA
jgi:hypothetical protein